MRITACLMAACCLAGPRGLSGQAEPVANYEAYYSAIRDVRPLGTHVAEVNGLILRREGAEFRFDKGRMWLLSPVAGRTIGVAFQGTGAFRYTPSTVMEQERLREFKKVTSVDELFSDVVLVFGDSTLEELTRTLAFRPGEEGNPLRARFREALSYLGKEEDRTLDPDVLLTFLNHERNDLFYAHMAHRGDPWIFMVNPREQEGVVLLTRPRGTGMVRFAEVMTQTRRTGQEARQLPGERNHEAVISHYQLESSMTQDATGGLRFRASATVDIAADSGGGPWVAFQLYEKLELDSVLSGEGILIPSFKGKDHHAVYVHLPRPLQPGEKQRVSLFYHGDVVESFGEWFYVESSIAWYPVSLEGRATATFDLTFHHPRSLTLASVGDRVDSSLAGTVETSRWVTPRPIRNASFNLGIFDATEVAEEGVVPITLLASEKGHRAAFGGGTSFGRVTRRISADISSAMKFFQTVYGPLPISRFYATEIPAGHGEAFPGLINLSYATFEPREDDGFDEYFRGHEVAHQWWGIGVDYATYHDRWISEGFASFSGLWFMQTRRGNNDRYFDHLQRYKASVMLRRNDALPVWLGHRVATARTGDDYNAIVYQKGAWVLHMLRMLTLDLQTMKEDRFGAIMRDFYQSHNGRRASTEDFRKVVEKHVGADMGWFFDQWIYRHPIPTYRVAWRTEPQPDGQQRLLLRVRQEQVPPEFLMYVPVTVDLGGNRLARARVRVTGETSEIAFPVPLPGPPRAVRFNDMEGVLAEVKNERW